MRTPFLLIISWQAAPLQHPIWKWGRVCVCVCVCVCFCFSAPTIWGIIGQVPGTMIREAWLQLASVILVTLYLQTHKKMFVCKNYCKVLSKHKQFGRCVNTSVNTSVNFIHHNPTICLPRTTLKMVWSETPIDCGSQELHTAPMQQATRHTISTKPVS